jgi:hypothetical protein
MRLWCLHVDGCEFTAEQPRPEVSPTDTDGESVVEDPDDQDTDAESEGAIDGGIVALVGVERRDETGVRRGDTTPAALARGASERIHEATTDLGESAIVVIPAPALASAPVEGPLPTTVFEHVDEEFDVGEGEYLRAPVGWHLAVDLSARGHPYASRVHEVTGARAGAPARDWQVIADGSVTSVAAADLSTAAGRYLDRRRSGDLAGEIDHRPAREAGLVGGEGDGAVLTPAGTLVRDLLREHLDDRLRAAGARPIATAPGRASHRGGPLDAVVESADDLPASLYAPDGADDERGPEMWTVVAEHAAALDALETQVALFGRWLADTGFDFVPVVTSPSAGEAATERARSIAGDIDRPTLLEQAGEESPLGVEMAVTDATGQPLATARSRLLAAEQIGDPEQSDDDPAYVVHTSIDCLGRFVIALCGQSESDERLFPTWLAPAQVRFVPLDPATHLARCRELADALEMAGVRADIDDRRLAVGERFAAAEAAGVPYISLVGNSEQSGETLPVTDRQARTERGWTVEELAAAVTGAVDGYPSAERRQPRLLGERLFATSRTDE